MSDLFHEEVPLEFIQQVFSTMRETPRHTYQVLTKRSGRLARIAEQLEWPANVWIGVSIESDRYTFRANDLRNITSAAVRFLSCEPLLGPLKTLDLDAIDWVIAGGESGPNHRPVEADWIRSIRDECSDRNVPFFFKQWGGRTPKAGGRALDGRIHSDTPARSSAVAS